MAASCFSLQTSPKICAADAETGWTVEDKNFEKSFQNNHFFLSIPTSFLMQNPPQQLQWPVTKMSVYNVGGRHIPVFVGCKFWSQEGSN